MVVTANHQARLGPRSCTWSRKCGRTMSQTRKLMTIFGRSLWSYRALKPVQSVTLRLGRKNLKILNRECLINKKSQKMASMIALITQINCFHLTSRSPKLVLTNTKTPLITRKRRKFPPKPKIHGKSSILNSRPSWTKAETLRRLN